MHISLPFLLNLLLTSRMVHDEVREVARGSLTFDYHILPTSAVRISWDKLPDTAWDTISTIKIFITEAWTELSERFSTLRGDYADIRKWTHDGRLERRSGQQLQELLEATGIPKLVVVVSGDAWRIAAMRMQSMHRIVSFLTALEVSDPLPLWPAVSDVLLGAIAYGDLQQVIFEITELNESQYRIVSNVNHGILDSSNQVPAKVGIATRWDYNTTRNSWKGSCVVTRLHKQD